jgi:hypothetical protein
MGLEVRCRARIGRRAAEGTALLESAEIRFRGDPKLVIPFGAIRDLEARDGWLHVKHDGGAAAFELGDAAARKWIDRIRNPRSRLDKLGVKPGHVVGVIGVDDADFAGELAARGAEVTNGKVPKGADLAFLGAAKKSDLSRLGAAAKAIARDGAIWVVWPKGRPELREDDVRAAALAGDLVDVKVVAFSAALSGLKLVIRKAKR